MIFIEFNLFADNMSVLHKSSYLKITYMEPFL
jgi:hypothetical protein